MQPHGMFIVRRKAGLLSYDKCEEIWSKYKKVREEGKNTHHVNQGVTKLQGDVSITFKNTFEASKEDHHQHLID